MRNQPAELLEDIYEGVIEGKYLERKKVRCMKLGLADVTGR